MMIKLAHGSGGKETEDLVKNVFLKHFTGESLQRMEDAAIFDLHGKAAFTTDSYVVTPLFFPGGDIGRLAICGTVNDLAVMGARPKYISAGFIIEEGMTTEVLEEIVKSMAAAAKEAGVTIVTGDTKVVEGQGGIYINTAGIGEIPQDRSVSPLFCKPGDAVIVSGNLGDHHACILSARMGIQNTIASDAAPLYGLTEALFEQGIRVKAMRDITRGGLATILNEISGSSSTGAEIWEEALPVSKQTASFCEILGLDPLYMGNEGKLLAVIDSQDADRAIEVIRQCRYGEHAAVIGNLRNEKGVAMITRLGGRRVVNPLYGEGLPRIC